MPPGSNKWKNWRNKGRLVGSDSDRIITVMSYIGRGFKAAQYQVLKLPRGKFGQRRPDIIIEMYGFKIPVELDGGVHGFNDEISETENTKDRNDDYVRDGYLPIILNHEQLKDLKISEEIYMKCALIAFEPIYRTMKRVALEKIE
jgi:hypothetical protein